MDHASATSSPGSVGDGPASGYDVFISYAREDRPFVGRLRDALLADGRQAWVDWEGIPASAKWMTEVRAAIDAAAAFCFVISPDSVESPVCREEAAHAAAANKRMVPILLREVDERLVPDAVVVHNWIDFTEPKSFEHAFHTLTEALLVDPDWTHSHTRLLVRANEWEASGCDDALLLRGADLASAEQWLSQSGAAGRRPAQQHTAYILASRRQATRRLRRVIAAVSVALVVALVLSGVALVERSHARQQRQVAENQSRTALSQLLAARALGALDDAPDRALLLAVSAWQVKPSLEARDALFRAVENVPQARAFFASPTTLSDVKGPLALSPDQRILASGGAAGLRLWDVHDRMAIGAPLTAQNVDAVAFSPDGSRVAAARSTLPITAGGSGTSSEASGDVVIWDVRARHLVLGPIATGSTGSLAFSPDGTMLATAGVGGVSFWSTATGRRVGRPLTRHYADAVAFSPDGRILATAGTRRPNDEGELASERPTPAQDLQLWTVATGDPLGDPLKSTDTGDIAFSPDGSLLAAAAEARVSGGGTVAVFSVDSGKHVGKPLAVKARAVAFEPSGKILITAGQDGVQQWGVTSTSTGLPLDTGGPVASGLTEDVVILGDGDGFITAGDLGIVQWNPQRFELLRRVAAGLASDVAFAAIDHQVIAGSYEHGLQLLTMAGGSALARASGDHSVRTRSLAVSADGKVLATAGSSGVRLWSVTTDLHPTESLSSQHADLVALSPDGHTVAAYTLPTGDAGDPSGLSVWDVSKDRPTGHKVSKASGQQHALAFSADGHTLAVAGDAGLQLWNVRTRRPTGRAITDTETWAVTFDPDGRTLAFATSSGVVFWDLRAKRPVGQSLPANAQGVGHALAFSPDGSILATTLAAHGLQLWNVAARQTLGSMLEMAPESAVAFSVDGAALGAGGIATTVWDLRPDAWVGAACAIANRELTRTEWETYVGIDVPYRTTCDHKVPSRR